MGGTPANGRISASAFCLLVTGVAMAWMTACVLGLMFLLGDAEMTFRKPRLIQTMPYFQTNDDLTALLSTNVKERFPQCPMSHSPSSLHFLSKEAQELWSDRPTSAHVNRNQSIALIMSIYKHSLDWLPEYLGEYKSQVSSITIITKSTEIPREEVVNNVLSAFPNQTSLEWISLPNTGRCDHSYAYWLSQSIPSIRHDHIYFFLKDNIDVHQTKVSVQRPFGDFLAMAQSEEGFACSQAFKPYHVTDILTTFSMASYVNPKDQNAAGEDAAMAFKSPYANMSEWLADMQIDLPRPITKVCYGGMFAVRGDHLLHPNSRQGLNQVYHRLVESLARGPDSLEEGHFAERTWAGLWASPLPPDRAMELVQYANKMWCTSTSIVGALDYESLPAQSSRVVWNCFLVVWQCFVRIRMLLADILSLLVGLAVGDYLRRRNHRPWWLRRWLSLPLVSQRRWSAPLDRHSVAKRNE